MNLRVGMRRKTARNEGHLKGNMEIKFSGYFLEYMNVILMKYLNNEEEEPQLAISYPNKASNTGTLSSN